MKPVLLVVSVVASLIALAGCEKKPASPAPAQPDAKSPETHTHDDGHDHNQGDEHHGPESSLGAEQAGPFRVGATLAGEIVAGKEVALEATAESDGAASLSALRAWIGTQDGVGSLKTKAEAEEHGFHAHLEVPDPLPAGSKLWIEIDYGQGETTVASFDLNN